MVRRDFGLPQFMDLNYFTCTLGEAAKHGLTNPPFENINSFLDYQAQHIPDQLAAGFFQPAKDGTAWTTKVYDFRQIHNVSNTLASILEKIDDVRDTETVALLCPSCEEFMFLWLALIRLDIAVLLLAPQCQPSAIEHLCKECEADVLIYHQNYAQLANEAVSLLSEKKPFCGIDIASLLGDNIEHAIEEEQKRAPSLPRNSRTLVDDVAYIHHTSGTSSGLPKPIHQTHNAAVGALPKLADGAYPSTLTTTPLYHGGIADAFRSWTSGAMIWLYPGKDVPITAANILKAFDAASSAPQQDHASPIAYFSCVPYVLQLLEEDPRGLDKLREMDIVGVGGAALPKEVGDRLVKQNVNLVSRFGSSECGFLLSSHRDYAKDKSWQYLRDNVGSNFIHFEPRDDGLAELVVLPTWPHRAKTNRDDGSFATSDLFEPHEDVPNAWRYHSRGDSQLTLITGKKFDPAPLEGALVDSSLVSDALIFGTSRPYPGVLVFRSEEGQDVSDAEILDEVWTLLEKINFESQDHARIAKDMIKPMPFQTEPLDKSSKGTLIRSRIEARFTEEIDAAYVEKDAESSEHVEDDQLSDHILGIVKQTLNRSEKLDVDTDLFSYGVDSIAAMRIRNRLQGLVGTGNPLPATVVETCGSVAKISKFIIDLRAGKTSEQSSAEDVQLMLDLVEQYSDFEEGSKTRLANGHTEPTADLKETVILTGATGALGAHVLDLCTKNPRIGKVVCLIRGEDETAARGLLEKAFEGRRLQSLSDAQIEVQVLPAKLGDSKLGLDEDVYASLAREVTVILHLAWEVNFRMNLRSFRSNSIAGTTNLIKLALSSPRTISPRFAFCSSVASVIAHHGDILEKSSNDPNDASPLGYSRSKWVTEQICQRAASKTRLKGHISILRVGQLAGNTTTGVWNEKEAWPMMLSTVKLVKALPEIQEEPLNWLPVDIAAQAFVEAAIERKNETNDDLEVIHVLNQHRETTWMDLLQWLKKEVEFEILSPSAWIEKLEAQQAQGVEHPAFKLIGLWKDNLCRDEDKADNNEAAESAPRFETIQSVKAATVLADVQPVDQAYFGRIWQWIDQTL